MYIPIMQFGGSFWRKNCKGRNRHLSIRLRSAWTAALSLLEIISYQGNVPDREHDKTGILIFTCIPLNLAKLLKRILLLFYIRYIYIVSI